MKIKIKIIKATRKLRGDNCDCSRIMSYKIR